MDVLLSARDMAETQRSFELRKVFAPEQAFSAENDNFNGYLNNDGALDAYAETIIWRLRAAHAMVSLVDRGHQYFLAGAVRETHLEQEDDEDDVVTQKQWFGCDSVPTPGGLCENTLSLNSSAEEYPCFVVNDLTQDDRFKDLPVVNGEVSSYRFYAGTPITTSHGINIGSLFMFDTKARDGLSRSQRKC
jgi:GAF domain-containing protein